MSQRVFRVILLCIGLVSIIAIILIARAYFMDIRTIVQIQDTHVSPSPSEPSRADSIHPFIKIDRTSGIAPRGGIWTIDLTTNSWSKCSIDLYQPNGQVLILGVQEAKANMIGPGAFNWAWKVPTMVSPGSWIARILCGTADNLATMDQIVEVQ